LLASSRFDIAWNVEDPRHSSAYLVSRGLWQEWQELFLAHTASRLLAELIEVSLSLSLSLCLPPSTPPSLSQSTGSSHTEGEREDQCHKYIGGQTFLDVFIV
jgi:hypothetical protein